MSEYLKTNTMKKLLLVLLLVSCGKDDANSASDTKGILES